MPPRKRHWHEVAEGVLCVHDTCNVYVLRSGSDAVLVDFGSGAALDLREELGVERFTDVLLTHHHRDQVQGLARAVEAGIHVWAPPVERDLIDRVESHWQEQSIDNQYDLTQNRFSLLEEVPVDGCVEEYRTGRYGDLDVYTLPTPGHTAGSVSYLVTVAGRRLVFTGDLLYGPGQVWSLAATQWSISGAEGTASTSLSLALVGDLEPDLLLPSHGEPIEDPAAAIRLTRARIEELMNLRREAPWDLDAWLRHPWKPVTPHLLRNNSSVAASYALLSETGAALLIDWGYDLTTGLTLSTRRAARRPLLASLAPLRRQFGVEQIEVVIPTHYHDDHVAGINLLRQAEGTEVWVPQSVEPVLTDPRRYDLPCLWYDPVPADRVLEAGETVRWHEYEITTYPLPGHTLYAAAIAVDVDGQRVLAVGDQQQAVETRTILNYQYRNLFEFDDYVRAIELYRAVGPDLLISGHGAIERVDDAYLERLLADAERIAALHRELLPLDVIDLGASGFPARIEPYRATVHQGGELELEVAVRNPLAEPAALRVQLVVPRGWTVMPALLDVELPPHGRDRLRFHVSPGMSTTRRARLAADLQVGNLHLGQQAEALVDVLEGSG
jgi:glyoxylase-like metal-dependent hydrolase (beta-lactamase superfamily II)